MNRGSAFLKIKGITNKLSGLAHRIFQFGAVMGCAVKPPKNTIKTPTIPVKRRKIREMTFNNDRLLTYCKSRISSRHPRAKTKRGVPYQELDRFISGA